MKYLTIPLFFLAFVHQGLESTIASTTDKNVLGNGGFSQPSFLTKYTQIESELVPYWTGINLKEITLVNANFYNQRWPKNTQALKLNSSVQIYQEFNAQINSTYKLSLNFSLASNETDITKPISRSIGVKIVINDQTIRQIIPSSLKVNQIDITFKGEHILNRLQLIGFTIDGNNCDTDDFLLIDNVTIVEIMDANRVKGYEEIYTLALGTANVLYTVPIIDVNRPINNYWLDFTFPNDMGRFCFSYMGQSNWFQITTQKKSKWKAIIIQGGSGSWKQWIKSFRLFSSDNGKDFISIEGGKQYNGNWDQNTKVRIDFPTIVQARSIRMVPVTWNNRPCFRIQAIALIQDE